ncbi:MAG: hypothetical protein KF883_01860 [Thermomicrobiales bacterium]|nr:hypothetical protein [Thermomicrobiales bacterium]
MATTPEPDQPQPARRAVVCFVDDRPALIQQTHALYLSLIDSDAQDTDLVAMGPEAALDRLPAGVVKVPQQPAADHPLWKSYRYINSIACMNGEGAGLLNAYTHVLRTDVDTFIMPGWNDFHPETFVWGEGAYSNSNDIRSRLLAISKAFGLTYRGYVNVGSTWYGPTAEVRRVAAVSEMIARHIFTEHFPDGEGAWPDWYQGVTTMYSGDIAVNHCIAEGSRSPVLDSWSTSQASVDQAVHVHCWHTDAMFSKHWFMSGRYDQIDLESIDTSIVANYCLDTSFRSVERLRQRDEQLMVERAPFGITPAGLPHRSG